MKIRLKFCLFMTTALMLSGCLPALHSQDQQPEQSSVLETSSAPDAYDPLQQHLQARSRVNPNDLNSAAYTTEGHAPEERTAVRVARVEEENIQQGLRINPTPDVSAAPVPPQAPVTQTIGAVAPAGSVSVTGVRTGDHPGKTRLVFDLTGPSGYSYKIDNTAQVLRIEMTNAHWSAAPETKLAGRFVSSYSASALQGGGSVVEIRLAGPAKLLTSVALPPNEIYGHRVYFDLAGL